MGRETNLTIAIASGKGGTGKTTIATNLAVLAARQGLDVQYVDCDVEEPNGHLFLRPQVTNSETVTVPVPQVDREICTGCGRCGQVCQYNAITCAGGEVLTFHEMCHSCGGCSLTCPVEAISEVPLEIGEIRLGQSGDLHFADGIMKVGSVRSPSMIRELKRRVRPQSVTILDAPPGTSCPVVQTLREVDFVLLAAEPTPFGLNDFRMAVDMVRELGLGFEVVINKATDDYVDFDEYCAREGIVVAARIPDSRSAAESYCRGELMIDSIPEALRSVEKLLGRLEDQLCAK